MLRKPIRSRTGRIRINGNINGSGTSNRMFRGLSRSRTRTDTTAPLATPEDDSRRTFEFGIQIGRRLGKSISRFERRHSLGREKPHQQSAVITKEHHSAVDYTDIDVPVEI